MMMNKKRMDTTMQSDRWSYLWLVIGTLLGFFWTIALVWWLSSVFVLRFVRTQKVWRGFLLAWLMTFVTVGITQYGMMNAMMPSPLPVYLITMAIGALPFTLPYLANPLDSIGAQAYFQYGNLVLMQLLSITGMWGITFLVSWFASVFNWAWECDFSWSNIRRGVAVYAGLLLLVMLYGSVRLTFAPPATGTVRMHGITAVDMRQNWAGLNQIKEKEGWEAMRQKAAEYRALYFEETVRETRAGAQLVHWPEQAVVVPGEDEPAFIAQAQEIARQEDVYLALAFGAVFQGDRPWENKLIVIDPTGDVVLEHHKYALVALEGTKGGDGVLRTVETPFGTLSAIICNDANHEEMVLQAGRNGTDILLAPSMEYRELDPIHAHMVIYRAVENGVTVVRQADNGLSFVADPYGRVVSAMDHWTASERVLLAQVPVESAFTIYPYIGDLFAWLSIVGFVATTIWVVIRERRVKQISR